MAEVDVQKTEPGSVPAPSGAAAEQDEAALWAELVAARSTEGADPSPPAEGRTEQVSNEPAAGAPAAASEPAASADIWANAPPELKAAFEETQKRAQALERDNRSFRGRTSALQRQLNELSKAPPAGAAAGNGEASPDVAEYLASDEWKTLKAEYPELVGPVEKVVAKLEGRLSQQERGLSSIDADRRQNSTVEQEVILTELVPDWKDVLGKHGNAFTAWLETQPRHIREAAQRNMTNFEDAEEAADVIGRFKQHVGAESGGPGKEPPGSGKSQLLADKRKRQLESSAAPQSRGPSVATGIPETGSEDAIWAALRAEREAKKRRA